MILVLVSVMLQMLVLDGTRNGILLIFVIGTGLGEGCGGGLDIGYSSWLW